MATFDGHPKSKFWSNRNIQKPHEVPLNSHKKIWFNCECGHEFDVQLNNVNLLARWCPYCSNKKLCGKCNICYNKSFASHCRANNLSNKNEIEPMYILKSSHKEYLFNCECGHEFKARISDITCKNTWCPHCSNPPKKLCVNIEKCVSCQHWSIKNKKKPFEVFKSSAEQFIFDCNKCNCEFTSKLCHITDGSWCPNCRYKTEDIVYTKLNKIYPSLQRQFKVDWCKDKKHLPFDFVLEEQKIIIECDGEQHWKQIAKWKTPEHNRERDIYKMKCANENGFSIIRIIQEDVYKNKYDWFVELCDNIEKITKLNRVQNIYMCKNDEYKDFD